MEKIGPMMNPAASNALDDLFPAPSSTLDFSVRFAVDPVSQAVLCNVLKDNHCRWHVLYNDRGYHNHIAHHQLTIWALGAPADALSASYKKYSESQRPLGLAPVIVTPDNFKTHLRKYRYYPSYLAFFTRYVREHGITSALESFIFSRDFNRPEAGANCNPDLLGRFLGGLFHPMIHVGCGLEFGLPGLVVEGLAMTTIQRNPITVGIPASFFLELSSASSSGTRIHTFTVLARILADSSLAYNTLQVEKSFFTTAFSRHASAIVKHMSDWDVDAADEHEVKRRMEELRWLNSVIYAVGGLQKGNSEFNADLYHMHLVASSLFLPSYTTFLSPSSLSLLLRGYLFTSLVWYVSRGRPLLDIAHFYVSTSLPPPVSIPGGTKPDRWRPIVQNALHHPDFHFSTIQRAFLHYGNVDLYGSREKGWIYRELESVTVIEGCRDEGWMTGLEQLDGTLFLRAALLTEQRMGRTITCDEKPREWDLKGFSWSPDSPDGETLKGVHSTI